MSVIVGTEIISEKDFFSMWFKEDVPKHKLSSSNYPCSWVPRNAWDRVELEMFVE